MSNTDWVGSDFCLTWVADYLFSKQRTNEEQSDSKLLLTIHVRWTLDLRFEQLSNIQIKFELKQY